MSTPDASDQTPPEDAALEGDGVDPDISPTTDEDGQPIPDPSTGLGAEPLDDPEDR